MMKISLKSRALILLTGLMASTLFIPSGFSQDYGQGGGVNNDYSSGTAVTPEARPRKVLYLFSADFPYVPGIQWPPAPGTETRFYQLLDQAMSKTPDLVLTDNPEKADYRVELRCGGILHCSKLLVDIKDPNRVVLGSFSLKNASYLWGFGGPNLKQTADTLTQRLDERINLFAQGGYGSTN